MVPLVKFPMVPLGESRTHAMSETLAFVSKLQIVQRAARRWTFSIWLLLSLLLGLQMVAAYSNCGRTRVVYAASLTHDIIVLIFLFTKPRVLWEVTLIMSMREPQVKLLEVSTPRYLAPATVSMITPCSM